AAILVVALVRQRREEFMQKVAVRAMDLDRIDTKPCRTPGSLGKSVAERFKPLLGQSGRGVLMGLEGHRRWRFRLPAIRVIGRKLSKIWPIASSVLSSHRPTSA